MIETRNGLVVAAKELVSCDLGGHTAILHTGSGIYYSLNPAGAFVWTLIQNRTTFGELYHALLSRFDVEPAQCERDLSALLADLADARLVELDR